jgi:thiol-disulfide isomerase/thioredoxin
MLRFVLDGIRRGRGANPGLVGLFGLLVALSACGGDAGPGPVATANPDYTAPELVEVEGSSVIANGAAAEFLNVYDSPPNQDLQLLFMQSHASTPIPGGGVLWPDADGARILEFDDRGVVGRVYQGAPAGERPLTQPMFVTADGDEVTAIEPDGTGLRFDSGEPTTWTTSVIDGPLMGVSRDRWSGSRTILEFHMGPVEADAPLLWATHNGKISPIGTVRMSRRRPFLGNLVNTGWTAADGEGTVYFASTIRPELSAYKTDGTHLWTSSWAPPNGVESPTLGIRNGEATPLFAVYQFGMTLGQDGLIYVLAAPDPDEGPNQLLAFDREGTLVRSGPVTERSAVFLGSKGHVYSIRPADAMSRTGEPERAEFPDFDLPALEGPDRVTLEAHRGKVVILNFWASWCGPCRREMPVLAAYAETLNPDEAVVVGLNEDVRAASALQFLSEIGGVPYTVGMGEGKLRNRYNYRGLPYTVVLDADLRVVRSFYGFGDSVDPIREVVEAEVAAAKQSGSE